jgi:hypothetical protein
MGFLQVREYDTGKLLWLEKNNLNKSIYFRHTIEKHVYVLQINSI